MNPTVFECSLEAIIKDFFVPTMQHKGQVSVEVARDLTRDALSVCFICDHCDVGWVGQISMAAIYQSSVEDGSDQMVREVKRLITKFDSFVCGGAAEQAEMAQWATNYLANGPVVHDDMMRAAKEAGYTPKKVAEWLGAMQFQSPRGITVATTPSPVSFTKDPPPPLEMPMTVFYPDVYELPENHPARKKVA